MAQSAHSFRAAVVEPGPVLISGEVQFWRMEPRHWAAALKSVKDLGIDHVATYLSWRRHEPESGQLNFGGPRSPELDVRRFLHLCADLDLSVQLKPGPWICAEEPGGGFPDWVLADFSLMALDHAGSMVSGYNPPFKHPMPSYASSAFRALAEHWFSAVWTELAEFTGRDGPIVATQLDNEPSLGFQDSMYGFDYHPESLDAFEEFVRERGSSTEGLPLPRPGVVSPLDDEWISYQEHYIADYLGWLRGLNQRLGVVGLVDFVNLNTHPVRGMPQSGRAIVERLTGSAPRVVVGEDHYFEPPVDASDIAGLALAAAQGAASGSALVWAPEMQSGIWRSPGEVTDYADPTRGDLAAWWGAAIALGYQGFNLYMLVDRENWDFAPISPSGEMRPVANDLRRFVQVIGSVDLLATYRPVPKVNLVWDEASRRSAYRVSGTQSQPLTAWDEPGARRAYTQTQSAAAWLTGAGIQFTLCSTPRELDRSLVTVAVDAVEGERWGLGDDGWIRFDLDSTSMSERLRAAGVLGLVGGDGPLVRLHRAPSGKEIVMVVRRDASAGGSTATLFVEGLVSGALVDTVTGDRWRIASERVVVDGLAVGLTILRVESD